MTILWSSMDPTAQGRLAFRRHWSFLLLGDCKEGINKIWETRRSWKNVFNVSLGPLTNLRGSKVGSESWMALNLCYGVLSSKIMDQNRQTLVSRNFILKVRC